ncbi:E3 ubiquitin-protein ligase TRIM21-like [Labrus mixtus]|uniref:E3 ubiquitin-protein ligase TRIM21-like n=1 Tax=Labrus mixtus TaxID=508554 RepID=UPI0029C0A6C5|nr:E3 ubiquitin-protein ligase TRIM21-like [Labrus mixtus]
MKHTLNMTTQTALNMASVPLELQFRCCICLDTFTDPVSIPCGHNFCMDCIEGFWDTKNQSQCPLCKETFRTRPTLRINRGFADIVEIFNRSPIQDLIQEEDEGNHYSHQVIHAEDVPCDICPRNKSTSVKSCLVCQTSYCDLHLTPHLRDAVLQRHRLTDPATFSTSHLCRKHNKPLTMFCRKDQAPVCEDCTERDHKQHNVVVIDKMSKKFKTRLRGSKTEIQQMIHERLTKMEQMKNSVDLSKKIKEKEVLRSAKVCSLLIATVERHQAELEEELEKRQQEAERRVEHLLGELEQEIQDLQNRSNELQHLELTQNPVHLLQSFPSLSRLPSTKEWSAVTVHSDNFMGTVTKAVYKIVDLWQQLADRLSAEEAEQMHQYAVDVTLDPDTASGWLVVSPDRKKVHSQMKKDHVTDNPQRFDACVCLLGKQSFKSGRRYWEVQVGDKTDWDLGLARESINRKGAISVSPNSGYWAICRRRGGSLSACAGPSVNLQLQEIPKKVGVFLDHDAGSVSFYDADSKTHIYTYSGCSFSEPLYPYFNPCVQDNGKNMAPLIICPLEEQYITLESDV